MSDVAEWAKVGEKVSWEVPFWLIFPMLTATIGMMVPEFFMAGK